MLGLSKEICIAVFLFCRGFQRLRRGGGWLWTALYMKNCAQALQLAYGGRFDRSARLPVNVSLTLLTHPRSTKTPNRPGHLLLTESPPRHYIGWLRNTTLLLFKPFHSCNLYHTGSTSLHSTYLKVTYLRDALPSLPFARSCEIEESFIMLYHQGYDPPTC